MKPIPQALWDELDRIDGETVIEGAELENWRIECRYQAESHPDMQRRSIFHGAAVAEKITRKQARLVASLAVYS
jgi:hypothetical protein